MSFGNDPWSDRIAKADEDGARRALLGEVGLWRAGRLTDIVAARQATFALSRLHWLLREADAAEREARQLLSLCQTPPRASAEELEAAKGWLGSLGASVPKLVPAPRSARPERPERGRKPRKDQPRREQPAKGKPANQAPSGPTLVDLAVAAGDAGDWTGALAKIRGKKGGRADMARFWLHLSRALANEDAEAARRDLERLAERTRARFSGGVAGSERPAREASSGSGQGSAEKPARPERQPRVDGAAAAPEGPSPRELARQRTDALKAALTAEPAPTVDALMPLLTDFGRLWRAIAAAERWGLDDGRMQGLLVAVDRASDGDRSIPGGTSLAVRRAAAGADGYKDLLTTEPTNARYGGPGIDVVVDLAVAAAADGWEVDRVLRGPTRKEMGRHPVLATVEDSLGGLWRVLVKRGELRAELWYVAELPPEGRAGVPTLLLEEHARVVVLPIDPELLGWYGGIEAPDAIGWTGEEGDAVRQALGALA